MQKIEGDPKPGERSFTLLETMMAMTIMVTVILHVASAQGNMIYNADYGRRITEAMWLARSLMAKVDYHWAYREFKDLDQKIERKKFGEEMGLPEDNDYTYSIHIAEWKFPILELLQNGGLGSSEDGPPQESAFPIKDALKGILGDHILKVAHVEVFWPEGAKEQSVQLSYLLTNQRKVDEYLRGQGRTYKDMLKKIDQEMNPQSNTNTPPPSVASCAAQGKTYNPTTNKCV